MKITSIISQHRSDFTANMQCEHCGHESIDRYGYDDNYYHTKVIPAMNCPKCGKTGEEYNNQQP